jgi:uncharacterized membrane protein YgdD (TMEM256/DUF423 family)
MNERARLLVAIAGLLGALAVGLGAYGAHGLSAALEGLPDAGKRMEWWQTAALYHLTHALAVAFVAWLATHRARAAGVAGMLFVIGIALFSGTLYAMALGAPRWLGAVTPLGGLSLIAGWITVLVSGLRRSR